ncbi:S8 family serine peptidase [Fluviicola sp.]|jgi:subtilisin family serine protease|uniref:S8 family serine peptidase n=1 Tax=Fluviicola sp. TaxID=1917219 RepID=UPI0028328BF8|nr:S8 family serine peptidase [Fluviicola sp.]MDR0801587.1 S8 family serine peptidase [Fluviicola sp.]
MKKALFFAGIFLNHLHGYAQKIYSNEEWTTHTGNVSQITRKATARSGSNIITVSNTLNASGNADVLVSKYDATGAILWQKTFDGPAGKDDYGVQLTVNNTTGDIYIAAVIGVADNTDTDFGILRYDASGNLQWSATWDANNGYDAPTDIELDGSGNIYVTGGAQALNGLPDFAVLKYSAAGNLLWQNGYDYAGLQDMAAMLTVFPAYIQVSGISASSLYTIDNATIKLKLTDGSFINDARVPIPGAGLDMPTGIVSDAGNNLYITGRIHNGTNTDIQVYKINQDFSIGWIKTFDSGFDDLSSGIGVDGNGNVYVCGSGSGANGIKAYTTIKYNPGGVQQWVKNYRAEGNNDAIASGIHVEPDGKIFVTGTVADGSNAWFTTVLYNPDGDIETVIQSRNQTGYALEPQIIKSGSDIYLTGIRNTSGSRSLTSIKYSLSERPLAVVTRDGVPAHIANEIVVRFGRHAVLPAAINRKETTFGELSQFVTPATIDSLEAAYPAINWSRAQTYKIFLRMTMADSVSISRNGHTVEVQPFWATLLINTGPYDEVEVIDSIHHRGFPLIQYVQANGIFKTQTDDPGFPLQESLVSTAHPEAHININPAWSKETGNPDIKVGVYDTGVRWSHEDLGSGFGCTDCVVKGGWDYETNASLLNTSNNGDPAGHGTQVAGIIGALRNNNLGVAGIAGGDMDMNKKGVSIHGFRAIGLGLSLTELCNALVEGTLSTTTGYGYGMHIMNNSWKRTVPYNSEVPLGATQNLFEDTQREIFRNQTVFVASRGNQQDSTYYFPSYAKQEYWVLNVGGSNTAGKRHGNSGTGGDLDFIAPHSDSLVYSTSGTADNAYSHFSGTSAAAAHASGVAALMLSYINNQPGLPNNLAPDDVEFLMQRYVRDIIPVASNDGYAVGYDNLSGWGLLDAGNIMEHINRDEYIVKHYIKDTIYQPIGEVLTGTTHFQDENMPYSTYMAEVYTTPYYFDNNLYPGDQIIDYWGLNSYSTCLAQQFWGPFTPAYINNERGVAFYSVTHDLSVPRGSVVHLIMDTYGNPLDYWYPVAPGDPIRIGFTLHIKSDYAGMEENPDELFSLSCYPNPTNDRLHIRFETKEHSDGYLTVYDVNGRLVHSRELASLPEGKHELDLDASVWTDGIYFVTLNVNNITAHAKVIKH